MLRFDVFVVEGGLLFSDARCCRHGFYPIHDAAHRGDLSCLEFLVGCNANVEAVDE